MPWKMNPFTNQLTYYEPGLPPPTEAGSVLTINGDGDDYEWVHPTEVIGDRIVSNPPNGFCRVTNIFVEPTTRKFWYQWDDGEGGEGFNTQPPSGFCRVINIYVNPTDRRFIYEWEDNPIQ